MRTQKIFAFVLIFVNVVCSGKAENNKSKFRGTNVKKSPCVLKFQKCIALPSRPSAAQCDAVLSKEYNCPKPKAANKERIGDYDYVVIREQEDSDRQIELNMYKDNRNANKTKTRDTQDDLKSERVRSASRNSRDRGEDNSSNNRGKASAGDATYAYAGTSGNRRNQKRLPSNDEEENNQNRRYNSRTNADAAGHREDYQQQRHAPNFRDVESFRRNSNNNKRNQQSRRTSDNDNDGHVYE